MSRTRLLVVVAAGVVLAACGGGGGGSTGSVTGLQGPEQVTIVEASAAAGLRLGRVTGSDYENATTHLWVRDRSMEALDTVNNILGYLHETNYWDPNVVNQGPYRALVRNDESNGESRGNSGPTFEEWVIDSTRASNSAPQVVHFWVQGAADTGQGGGPPALIYGKLTLTAEPSTGNPLGEFTLVFKQLLASVSPTSTSPIFQGVLSSLARNDGLSELTFHMSHGDPDGTVGPGEFAMRQRVHVIGDPTTDSGRAYTETKQVSNFGSLYTEAGEYLLQFNASYLARKDVNTTAVEVFDRNSFTSYIHRYGLYDATTESFVSRNSGFPVTTEGGEHGYAGFHGMWFPDSVSVTDGMTLLRQSFTPGVAPTAYTAVVVPGRLEKRVRSSLTLGDLLNEDLDTFDPSIGTEVRVQFDGTHLVKVAERQGGSFAPVTPSNIEGNYFTGQWLGFWSPGRGQVQMVMPATLATSTPVYVWSNTTITADSPEVAGGPLTLYGYFHQLRPDITQAQANFEGGETPYYPDASSASSGNMTYVFDPATLMLTESGHDVRLADGVSASSGPGSFGFDCGPMFATALGNLAEAMNQTTTYQWMTGGNSWNQLRTLKDGNGAFVSFDEPLRFTYVHSENGSEFDGRSFFLEWDGSNLGGLPGAEDSTYHRWYPVLNIPTGTLLTSGGHDYKIKQLEGEQIMVAVGDPSGVIAAQGFDLDTVVTQPDGSNYSDPAIGAMPTVTDPPKFVGGVAQ